MIDNLSILLSHGLLLIAFWILIQRDDVDAEDPPMPDKQPEGFAHGRLKNSKLNRHKPQNPFRRRPGNREKDQGDADHA
ncbi:MAG: hypothetical protein HC843_00330 [Sphingomonadales bacterium]|nr:hypothetical protein [Sphingomonadales bacterium]